MWRCIIAHLNKRHVVYVLTLAGTERVPPPARKNGLLDLADA